MASIAVCLDDKYASSWRRPSDPCPVCSWHRHGLQVLCVLQSPSPFCSVHSRPISQEKRCLCFPTLFGRSEDLEDGELGSQRTIVPRLEFSLFLYQKRRGVWMVVANFLVAEFCVLEPIQLD